MKATTIGCLPTQALAFLAVFVYATQAFAFEWKPGFSFMEGMGSHAEPYRPTTTMCFETAFEGA